jgi:SnoaL-like domain
LLRDFIEAHEGGDPAAAVALLREDIRVTMPPHPFLYEGLDAIAPLLEQSVGADAVGDWLLVPTRANRQPTAASYRRRPGDSEHRAFKFDVLRVEGGAIAQITTFDDRLFDPFGLPRTWPERRTS